jgi:hypothetical protein
MQNLFVSFMRSVVPIVVGLVLSGAAYIGLDLDDPMVTMYVTAGLTASYYAVFRLLEELAGRMAWRPLQLLAGVLLGWARPPQYVEPVTAPVRMKLDKVAMREDIDSFVRYLGNALDGKSGGDRGAR